MLPVSSNTFAVTYVMLGLKTGFWVFKTAAIVFNYAEFSLQEMQRALITGKVSGLPVNII